MTHIPPSPPDGGSPTRLELVQRAVKQWASQLRDLSGRNNLLNCRQLRRGTLDISDIDERALMSLLAGRAWRIANLVPPDDREDAVRRARAIYNKAKENFEERGLSTLYLGCGFATWDKGQLAWAPNAPVLLRPAVLRPVGSTQEDFELSLVDEMEVNEALAQFLRTHFSCNIDSEKLLGHVEGLIDEVWELTRAFEWLTSEADEVAGFSIQPAFVLTNFTYAKLPMVRDLEAAVEVIEQHDLIAALAGDADARSAILSLSSNADDVPSPDDVPLADEFVVLDADASQTYAINSVLGGHNLIVKGPPGTGKSQTIANLIATLLARRKRVLFVAEKRAAIDAVLKRLTPLGLGELVLDLHRSGTTRRAFASTIAHALDVIRSVPAIDTSQLDSQVEAMRAELNHYVNELHQIRDPWGSSIYDFRAELLGIPTELTARLPFSPDLLQRLGAAQQQAYEAEIAELAALDGFRLNRAGTGWVNARVESDDEARAAYALVEKARSAYDRAREGFAEASAEMGSRPAVTVSDWSDELDCWSRVSTVVSQLDAGFFDGDLRTLTGDMAPAASWFRRALATVVSRRYRTARRTVRSSSVAGKIAAKDLLELCRTALEACERWSDLGAPGTPKKPPARLGDLPLLLESADGFLRAVAELTQEPTAEDLSRISADLDRLLSNRATLVNLPRIHKLARDLQGVGLGELLVLLESQSASEEEAPRIFRAVWIQAILDHLAFSDRAVGAFDGARQDKAVERYMERDLERLESVPGLIRRIWAENATAVREAFPDQAQLLARQANLKQRHKPIRDLVAETSDVLLGVQPCWAMSPLMVSQVLPARTTFDVVIFDEASQITPADAITSIFRGRQLVVAGDERQLPPSPFFVSETTEDEDELEEVPQKTVSEQLAGTVGFESVLDALIPMLPFRWLQWHYRSQDERLIAFSNAHIYDRVLVTFPGIGGDICVEHVAVPSELSEETNSPASEVRVVVDLILRHAASRPAESLGVIAMGIKHAQRVDEALRTTLKERPEFETFFAEDRDEPFFVKNLERVQGDERDAIILSIGYGKNPRGQLVYRFGPLLVSGGERRLNVAITRAKKRMTLVSSFTSADMDPDKLNSEGMRLLRQYVQYMEHGGRTLGDVMLEKPPLNPFEIDVRDTLAARRLNLIPQYGVSGFRIDFAVTHPLQRGRMVLAIECDGASYHSSESARERDRLRQEHLERLGWTFHRIWSSEWFADKQAATDKAVAAYEGAIADGAEPPQTVLPPPPPVVGGSAAAPTRRLPRPQFSPGYTIAEYSRRTLDAVVAWVQSDGLLRTRAELTDEAIRELGFERRGKNIVAAVSAAVDRVLRSPPSTSV